MDLSESGCLFGKHDVRAYVCVKPSLLISVDEKQQTSNLSK